MSGKQRRIPFQVEVSRIIEVLARQIYQSPLALLRENAQNAFDAVALRRHKGDQFDPRIDVEIQPTKLVIRDHGIGMTADDLRDHYWRAGSSSKNTPEARRAGVVGTFGIGAMANFGIAERLSVETESAITGERTFSVAEKATLSTTEDTILLESRPPNGQPGTEVTAYLPASSLVDVAQAVGYVTEFVGFVETPVFVNGELVSQRDLHASVPPLTDKLIPLPASSLSASVAADLDLSISPATGEVWVRARAIQFAGEALDGEVVLRQGASAIRTFRGGFGLAAVTVHSAYGLGGVANLRALEPTAGREALTTNSLQLLQEIVTGIDAVISVQLARHKEADLNGPFLEWVRRHRRFDLCGKLRARVEPESRRVALERLKADSQARPLLLYSGSDQSIIDAVATDDSTLVVLAATNPRRTCESEYLKLYCKTEPVTDAPTILNKKAASTWTIAEQAVAFRLTSILESDYFLPVEVSIGKLSHGLPIITDPGTKPVEIVIDTEAPSFGGLVQLYEADYSSFLSMAKDVVRNVVFPRVSDLVPSSTRQGANAFLKSIRRTKDVFEYEFGDLDTFSSIWEGYLQGELSMAEAASRATLMVQRNVQYLDASASQRIQDIVLDVVENEATLDVEPAPGPAPAIIRTDVEADAKLLTIDSDAPSVKGYHTFIALSDRVQEERGEFFLQPHSTAIVWGGQKLLFVFEHHSGEFGLYYDLQTAQVVSATSGGGPFPTATIILKNRIFVPIPDIVATAFVPEPGERKRFEVRSDLLFTEREEPGAA